MLIFQNTQYEELGAEIRKQIDGCESVLCGVVELNLGVHDFIFGFEWKGESLDRWIVIVFDNGIRCSSDFEIEELKRWL